MIEPWRQQQCEKHFPNQWPDALRLIAAAEEIGLDGFPSLGSTEDGDVDEMCITFYNGREVVGCASYAEDDVGWAGYIEGMRWKDFSTLSGVDGLINALKSWSIDRDGRNEWFTK